MVPLSGAFLLLLIYFISTCYHSVFSHQSLAVANVMERYAAA